MKYFTAESLEAAKQLAGQHFSRDAAQLHVEVVRKGEALFPWLILAAPLQDREILNAAGRYTVVYDPSGVFLEIYRNRGTGQPVDRDEVQKYLQRKGLQQVNLKEVLSLLTAGAGRMKIAPAQSAVTLDEGLDVIVPADGLSCSIRFLSPDEGGGRMTPEEVSQKLRDAGVVYGLREEWIAGALAERIYGKLYPVAEGKPKEDGEAGRLVFHFCQTKTGAPAKLDSGKTDYYQLDLFEPVVEGQLLVTRELATPGVPGQTVRGAEIPPRPGKEVQLPKSKNTVVNEDRTTMSSAKNGRVELARGTVIVSDVYKVNGDCDFGIGNLDFDGSIDITGSVISGLVIRASGSISVGGVVEAAELVAGGNIELKRGMQGTDKGKLVAGGSISAMFLERCTAIAGEDVHIDAVIHSNIEGMNVRASGRRGSIVGGVTKAVGTVIANSIGSISNSLTEIEIGIGQSKRERLKTLDQELENARKEIEKLDKIEDYLARVGPAMSAENAQRIRISAAENRRVDEELIETYTAEAEVLRAELQNATGGKVHVLDTAYRGARITIGPATYRIREDIPFASFKYRGGEIVFSACELDPGKFK